MPATTIDNQYPKKEKNMNPKILDQVMRRMEAQACRTPSKGLSPSRVTTTRSGRASAALAVWGFCPHHTRPALSTAPYAVLAPGGTRCTSLSSAVILMDGSANSSSGIS